MVLERAVALSARGWHLNLVAPPGPLCDAATAQGISVRECRVPIRDIRSALASSNPDVYHLFSYGPVTRPLARLGQRAGKPVVVTVSALGFPGGFRSRLFLRRAALVTAPSRTVLRELQDSGVRIRHAELLPDFPLDWANREPSRSPFETRAPDAMVVGWVGRFDPVKRLEDVLTSFARLVEVVPQAALKIAAAPYSFGTITASDYASRIIRLSDALGVRDKITIRDDTPDVYAFLDAIDVFVLSSERETFSRATFEAMVMARAIVATRAAAVAEMIHDGKNGILVDVGDVAAMTRGLLTLSGDRARAVRLGAAARASAADLGAKYDVIARLEEIYAVLIMRSRRCAKV